MRRKGNLKTSSSLLGKQNYFNFHVPKDDNKIKFIPFSTAIMRLLLSSL